MFSSVLEVSLLLFSVFLFLIVVVLIVRIIIIRQNHSHTLTLVNRLLEALPQEKEFSTETTTYFNKTAPILLKSLMQLNSHIKMIVDYSKFVRSGQNELPTSMVASRADDNIILDSLASVHQTIIWHKTEALLQNKIDENIKYHLDLLLKNDQIDLAAQALASALNRTTESIYTVIYLKKKNDDNKIQLLANHPNRTPEVHAMEVTYGEGTLGQSALERNLVLKKIPVNDLGINHELAVPVMIGTELIGVIGCGFDREPGEFEQTFLIRIAPFIAAHFSHLIIDEVANAHMAENRLLKEELFEAVKKLQDTENLLSDYEEKLRDITEDQLNQLSVLRDASIFYEMNLNGFITQANERFTTICGMDEKNIIGKKHDFNWNRDNADDYGNLYNHLWAHLSEGRVWTGIIEKKNANDNSYWVQSTVTPVLDANFQPTKYLCVEFDISDRKRQELEFAKAIIDYQKQELELHEKAVELNASQEEIKKTHLELSGQINALNHAAIVSETDFQGRIISINENFIRISKYPREELIGENHRILKSGHQADEIFETLWRTVSKGQVWKGEFKNRAKDGSYFWISSTITPVSDENNQIIKYIGVGYNISSQKLQDEQLRAALELSQAQEAELRNNADELQTAQMEMRKTQLELRGQIGALNNAGIVAETDLRGNITFINDAFCEISKFSRDELLKKNHRLLKSGQHSDDYFFELWESISKGKVWTGKFKNRASDGTFYWVVSTITPVLGFDSKPIKYIGVSFDMTALVLQEEQLKESLERSQNQEEALRRNELKMLETQLELKGQVSALHNAAIVSETDPSGNIISVNDPFIIISRYSREELLGQNHRILRSNAHGESFFKNMWQTISDGRIWKGEINNIAKDGTEYWATATIAPVLDTDHRPIKYIGIQFDITALKKQEVKIREALTLAEHQAVEIRDKQQQMDSIFSNIPGIIYRRLPDSFWTMILISDHVEDILGIPAGDFVHNRRSFVDLIHPEDVYAINQGIDTALQNRTSFNLTYRVYNSHREVIWVREEGRGVFNDFGNLIYVDGAIFDVTLQKKLEENLRRALDQSHEQQQQLHQNAQVMREQQIILAGQISALNNAGIVSETDVDGKITYVNDEAILKWGYSREELLRNNHRILKSKAHEPEFFRKMWLTISSGNVWKGVIKNRTKDENEYWSLLTITPVLDTEKKPIKYIAVAYDITREKRQANRIKVLFEETRKKETELRKYSEALEKIQEDILNSQVELTGHLEALNKAAIVVETDAQGRIFSINDFGLEVWGYHRHEVIGNTHQLIRSEVHTDAFFEELWKTISGGQTWQGKINNKRKDGSPFRVQLTITPVLDNHNIPIRFVAIGFVLDHFEKGTESNYNQETTASSDALESLYQHQITYLNNKITELEQQMFKSVTEKPRLSVQDLPFSAAFLDEKGLVLDSNRFYREIFYLAGQNGTTFTVKDFLSPDAWEQLFHKNQTKESLSIVTISDKKRHISLGVKYQSHDFPANSVLLHVLLPFNEES